MLIIMITNNLMMLVSKEENHHKNNNIIKNTILSRTFIRIMKMLVFREEDLLINIRIIITKI